MSLQPDLSLYRKRVSLVSRIGIDFLLLVSVFFLTRGNLLAELYPFGVALIITTAFRRRHLLWPVIIIAITSSYYAGPVPDYSRLFLFLFLGLVLTFYPSLQQSSVLTQASLAPGTVILVKGTALSIWYPSFYGWVLILFESLLAWGICMVFLETTIAVRKQERLFGTGLFCLGFLLGAQGVEIYGFSLQSLLSNYIILLMAVAGGAGAGAASGAALGLLASISNLATPAMAGMMAFAGLVAGALKSLGKPGVISGFLLAHLFLANYFLGQDSVVHALREGGLIALLLMVTPVFLINNLGEFLFTAPIRRETKVDNRKREKLREALKSISSSLKFQGFSETPITVIKQAARITCQGCTASKVCWELERDQMLNTLLDLLHRSSHRALTGDDIPEWLKLRCSRSRELLSSLTVQGEKVDLQSKEDDVTKWLIRFCDSLSVKLAEEERVENSAPDKPENLPKWKISIGTASIPRHQSDITGDSYLAAKLDDNNHILVLGDGMGAGRHAADTSCTAIEMVRDLLAAGFSTDLTLHTVNTIMMLRAGKESYTTLDLAVINYGSGKLEMYKFGACPSFIYRDGVVKIHNKNSPPVGILEEIRVEPLQEDIQDRDLLVMVSDGILESHKCLSEKDKWLVKALQRAGDSRPQEIAERLLKQARALVNNKPQDDMTVLVARLEKQDV